MLTLPKHFIPYLIVLVGCVVWITWHTYPNAPSFNIHPSSLLPASYRTPFHASPKRCNPYETPGFLDLPQEKVRQRWQSFDEKCDTPPLFASFLRAAYHTPEGFSAPENDLTRDLYIDWARGEEDPWGNSWEDMEWARGRTVLFNADSIGRFQVEWLCGLAGGDYARLGDDHPWWPHDEWVTVNHETHHRQKRGPNHDPHYCYVQNLDFFMLHVQTFGVDEEEHWAYREGDVLGPYLYEERLEVLGKALIDSVNKHVERKEGVDMVLLMSALWDNARFNRDMLNAGMNPEDNLSSEQIRGFKQRIQTITEAAVKLFPNTPIKWEGTHFPIGRQNSGWYYADVQVKDGRPPSHNLNHLIAMSQAVKGAVDEVSRAGAGKQVGMMPWGDVMMGTERYMMDDVHPNPFPSMMVWGDILLYYLRDAIESRA